MTGVQTCALPILEVLTVPLSEALAWVDSGLVHDAKTVVGLLMAERRLR